MRGQVAVDTETDELGAMSAGLCGVSLALEPGLACYIPIDHRGDGLLSERPAQLTLDQLQAILGPMLADPATRKIGQNIKYDLMVLARHGMPVIGYDDTMLMSYALDAGTRGGHGMDELSAEPPRPQAGRVQGCVRHGQEGDQLRERRSQAGHALRGRGCGRDAAAVRPLQAAPRRRSCHARLRKARSPADRRRRGHGSRGRQGRSRGARGPEPRLWRGDRPPRSANLRGRGPPVQPRLGQATGRSAVREARLRGRQEGQIGQLRHRRRHFGAPRRRGRADRARRCSTGGS